MGVVSHQSPFAYQTVVFALTSSELERQVESAKRRNVRAEGVVASAAHLMPSARQ